MRKEMVIIVVLTLLVNLPLFNAIGEGDSLKVVLSVRPLDDNYPFNVSDEVIVEVRVFDKGQLTDPDTPPQVTLNKYGPNQREISVTKSDTGFYSGTFIILETDLEDDIQLGINAHATLGKDSEGDYIYDESSMSETIWLNRKGDLTIDIECEEVATWFIESSPGDEIDFSITVENNNITVNPESFTLDADDEPITCSNPDVGVFKASYTVDPSIKEDTIIFIVAEAEYGDDSSSSYIEIRVNFYSIWYHEIEISDTSAEFELYVSDMNGKAVWGAEINLYYRSFEDEGTLSGFTDSKGKVSFTIDHDNASIIYIDGSAEKSGKTQTIDGNIKITDIWGPYVYHDFWVDRQTDTNEIQPGDSVILDYIGYNNTEPLDNQIIYYYIYSRERFIDSGSTTTDSVGNFAINVAIPEDVNGIILDFESPFEPEIGEWIVVGLDSDDNLSYQEDFDWINFYNMIYDDNIQIKTESFNIHDIATISVSLSDSNNILPYVSVAPGEYSLDEDSMESPRFDWVPWSGEYVSSPFFLVYNREEDNFCREFLLPEFLPRDEPYTVIVYFRKSTEIHWNYIYITPGNNNDAEDEEPDDGFSNLFSNDSGLPCIALIVGLFLLFTFVKYIGFRRRRKKSQL